MTRTASPPTSSRRGFLGLTHIRGKRQDGKFILVWLTTARRMRARPREIKETL